MQEAQVSLHSSTPDAKLLHLHETQHGAHTWEAGEGWGTRWAQAVELKRPVCKVSCAIV